MAGADFVDGCAGFAAEEFDSDGAGGVAVGFGDGCVGRCGDVDEGRGVWRYRDFEADGAALAVPVGFDFAVGGEMGSADEGQVARQDRDDDVLEAGLSGSGRMPPRRSYIQTARSPICMTWLPEFMAGSAVSPFQSSQTVVAPFSTM